MKQNWKLLFLPLCVAICCNFLTVTNLIAGSNRLRISAQVIARGDANTDFRQARTAVFPAHPHSALTVMSQTTLQGSHGYRDVFFQTSHDLGQTWSAPTVAPSLKRSQQPDGSDHVFSDIWPTYHPQSGKVLLTGKIFTFEGGTKENTLREHIGYAVFDPETTTFGPVMILAVPEKDQDGRPIIAPNAGCHQPVIQNNGEILLPFRYQTAEKPRRYTSSVARCQFDGTHLTFVEQGTRHTIKTGRGLYEPSLIAHAGRYYFTMRADDGAYVAESDDGLNFSAHKPWTFDDGTLLGSKNTQQHWLTLGGKLYLLYTRAGANNDDVFRQRAPLFIAEVNPESLLVIRSTEQIVLPNDGGLYGNFGVCHVSLNEAWVTCADDGGKRKATPDTGNEVYLIRLKN
jgi:hypothetical protein